MDTQRDRYQAMEVIANARLCMAAAPDLLVQVAEHNTPRLQEPTDGLRAHK